MTIKISYPPSAHRLLAELQETSYWYNHRNDVLLAAIQRIPPRGPILDVGGGNGNVSLALKRAGFETTVVEPGPEAVRTARARGLRVIEEPFQNLLIEPRSIAAIGSFSVLEHIEDDKAMLRGFYNALVPGGRVYIEVPAYSWLWSSRDVAAGHFRRYTISQLQKRVVEAGFTKLYSTYFFVGLVAPIFALRTLPNAIGFNCNSSPKRTRAEHAPLRGLSRAILEPLFALEKRIITNGKFIPFGTSALIIAEKHKDEP